MITILLKRKVFMKKLLAIITFVVLLMCLCSCEQGTQNTKYTKSTLATQVADAVNLMCEKLGTVNKENGNTLYYREIDFLTIDGKEYYYGETVEIISDNGETTEKVIGHFLVSKSDGKIYPDAEFDYETREATFGDELQ